MNRYDKLYKAVPEIEQKFQQHDRDLLETEKVADRERLIDKRPPETPSKETISLSIVKEPGVDLIPLNESRFSVSILESGQRKEVREACLRGDRSVQSHPAKGCEVQG